jgi:hypothetical protein
VAIVSSCPLRCPIPPRSCRCRPRRSTSSSRWRKKTVTVTPSCRTSSSVPTARSGDQSLIRESHQRPEPALDDERRRYYRITPLGEAVARAEVRRMGELVRMARAQGLVFGNG